MYHATLRSNTAVTSAIGIRNIADAPKIKYVVRYMFAHMVAVSLSFVNAILCYRSKAYHGVFNGVLVAASLWFGSVK